MSCHHDCTPELLWVDLVILTILAGWLPDEIWFAHFFYEDDFYFIGISFRPELVFTRTDFTTFAGLVFGVFIQTICFTTKEERSLAR